VLKLNHKFKISGLVHFLLDKKGLEKQVWIFLRLHLD